MLNNSRWFNVIGNFLLLRLCNFVTVLIRDPVFLEYILKKLKIFRPTRPMRKGDFISAKYLLLFGFKLSIYISRSKKRPGFQNETE